MCTGGATSPTSDCYIMAPPALPKVSPAAQNSFPARRPANHRLAGRLVCWYGSILIILFALLMLVNAKVPECDPDITVESLSSSSPSSAAAMTWDVGFSISDTKTYENLTMKATLFNGNVPVSESTTLGPVVRNASTTSATFSIPDTTALHARYLTPCTTVSNLTAKLEIEERVPLVKSTRRLMIVCENVVVLLPSNSSCYSSSPPAVLGRASCRNDSSDLQEILQLTLGSTAVFVFLVFAGHFALQVLFPMYVVG